MPVEKIPMKREKFRIKANIFLCLSEIPLTKPLIYGNVPKLIKDFT
jgi:hypothetical protein